MLFVFMENMLLWSRISKSFQMLRCWRLILNCVFKTPIPRLILKSLQVFESFQVLFSNLDKRNHTSQFIFLFLYIELHIYRNYNRILKESKTIMNYSNIGTILFHKLFFPCQWFYEVRSICNFQEKISSLIIFFYETVIWVEQRSNQRET